MTDKERIFSDIIIYTGNGYELKDSIRWEWVKPDTPLSKGDIVKGLTGRENKWSISFFEERIPDGLLVREIGGNNTCTYTNEQFIVLRNFPEEWKLCGDEYKFNNKFKKAISDQYMWRTNGIAFNDKSVTLHLRNIFDRSEFSFDFKIEKSLNKTTIKSIKKFLIEKINSK